MEVKYEQISDFHIDRLRNSYPFDMPFFHYHSAYELFVVTKNTRKVIVGDKVIDANEGDVVLVKPMVIHRTTGARCSRTVINFSYEHLKKYFSDVAINKITKCFDVNKISLKGQSYSDFLEYCNNLFDSDREKEDGFCALTGALLLLCNNMESSAGEKEEKDSDVASKVMDFIKSNYKNLSTIDEVAKSIFVSKEHMCRVFKNKYNMTVVSYINLLKLNEACGLLTDTQNSVRSIAEKCGFHSVSYFHRIFKANYDMSPIEFRDIYSKKDKSYNV